MDFNTILEAGDLAGKRALVRVDWNVPIKDGKVVDDFRIKKSLPTIEYLRKAGAKIVLASHLDAKEGTTLRPVYEHVKQFLPLTFIEPSDIVLLENVRQDPGEEADTRDYALKLAALGDLYVNEAFSASHRAHASIVGVPKLLPSFAGLQFTEEVKQLSKAFYPQHPFLFILGGAKFETKLPLVNKFLNIADEICIMGALAKPASAQFAGNPKIIFPLGDIAALDADEANVALLRDHVARSRFVLWNGPLGKYEDGYVKGTEDLARALAESGKEVIVGGGDTLTAIQTLGIENKFAFVSTGGGAMLDFLATGTLPGIEALKKK